MEIGASRSSEARFEAYVQELTEVIGHADRARPLSDYCQGLLLPCERKSVEPMAAVTAPSRVAAQHQSLLHFVGEAPWSDERLLSKVRELVLPAIERHGPIEAWIIDDTGFASKVAHRVIFMDRGEIVEDALKTDFFGSPRSDRAQKFLSKILSH